MAQNNDEFQTVLQEALAGSESAIRELFDKYEHVLREAIRGRLHRKVRSKFDSADFSQDVWASFFAQPAEKRVFENPENLLAFLMTLAKNKVVESMRQRLTFQKYDVHREQSLDDSKVMQKEDLVARHRTPSQLAMAREEWSEFLRRQPLVYRRIFILLSEGNTHAQIAAELGINVRTVERVVAKAGAK